MTTDYCGFTDDGDMIAAYDAYVLEGGELSLLSWIYYWLPEHGITTVPFDGSKPFYIDIVQGKVVNVE